jgi:hypothetical protein
MSDAAPARSQDEGAAHNHASRCTVQVFERAAPEPGNLEAFFTGPGTWSSAFWM